MDKIIEAVLRQSFAAADKTAARVPTGLYSVRAGGAITAFAYDGGGYRIDCLCPGYDEAYDFFSYPAEFSEMIAAWF